MNPDEHDPTGWKLYRSFYRPARRRLALGVTLAVIQMGFLLPVPWLVGRAIDEVIPSGDRGDLLLLGAAVVTLTVCGTAMTLLARTLVVTVAKRATADLRRAMVERIHALPRWEQQRHDVAGLHDQLINETMRVDSMAVALIADLLPSAVLAAGIGVVLVVLDWRLSLVALGIAAGMALASLVLRRTMEPANLRLHRAWEGYHRVGLTALRALDLTRARAAEDDAVASVNHHIEVLRSSSRRRDLVAARHVLVQQAIIAVGATAVLVIGGIAVSTGDLTLGELISFYACVALLRGPLGSVAAAGPAVIEGRQSLRRIAELFAPPHEPLPEGTERPEPFGGCLVLDDVWYAYDGEPVLRGVSLALQPGRVLALLGPNGSGKSTAVHLLLGEHRPAKGTVRLDGVPLDRVDLRWFRRRVGVVHQDPFLLPGSVWENLTYGCPDVHPADVRRALELATADEVVARLRDGLDTVVGDDAHRLSGGMRQRLAIARALVGDPAVLVLDEPTNHLDEASIERILTNLRRLPHRPAVLLVTHHRALIGIADDVVELRDGVVVAPQHPPGPDGPGADGPTCDL